MSEAKTLSLNVAFNERHTHESQRYYNHAVSCLAPLRIDDQATDTRNATTTARTPRAPPIHATEGHEPTTAREPSEGEARARRCRAGAAADASGEAATNNEEPRSGGRRSRRAKPPRRAASERSERAVKLKRSDLTDRLYQLCHTRNRPFCIALKAISSSNACLMEYTVEDDT